MFEQALLVFASLIGFSALVALVVNVLKSLGIVKEGYVTRWVAGFNLVGILAVYVALKFFPGFEILPIDSALAEIATIGSFIFTEVLMIFGSRLTHEAVKGVPAVGKSFTVDNQRAHGKYIAD